MAGLVSQTAGLSTGLPVVAPPELLIFDLDGTLYIDGAALPKAVSTIQQLRAQGYGLRFMTNTTTKTQAQLLAQLQHMGFEVLAHELVSAPQAARLYLQQLQAERPHGLKVWPVLSPAITAEFAEFELVQPPQQPDIVVLGDIGEAWNLALINQLFNALQQGAQLIALHKNRFWQTGQGLHVDIGLFVAGLEYVTGKPALVMGKPALPFFEQVLQSAGCYAHEALLLGDDIDSDIGGAQQAGITAILVQTGKYRADYAKRSIIQPDALLASVAQLPDYLARAYS